MYDQPHVLDPDLSSFIRQSLSEKIYKINKNKKYSNSFATLSQIFGHLAFVKKQNLIRFEVQVFIGPSSRLENTRQVLEVLLITDF